MAAVGDPAEALGQAIAEESAGEWLEPADPSSTNDLYQLRSCLRHLVLSYKHLPSPAALLDGQLNLRYKNQAFGKLLHLYNYPASQSFFNVFGRNLPPEQASHIYQALHSDETGFSWNGDIRHKTHDLVTLITRVKMVPFFRMAERVEEPLAWTVFLDDITADLNNGLRQTFIGLLAASKIKDNDTGKHIERVNLYSKALSETIFREKLDPSIDADFVDEIGFLAAMHDVGKIGTPDDILNKQGPLSEAEWVLMREHTINGAFILSSHPNRMATQIAQSHHERWDGTGYPYRLEGEMIPLPARIVAVADVYDALRMRRSYKAPFSHETASQIIIADSGKQFDPSLVIIFKRIHQQFDRIFNENAD
ncbi:MAG TPA: hypothetical protein DD477_12980 [Spirochaetaceae bacterium]|nr:hypothetical protein [Spirochaetaceae bacterium]HBO42111.1 hypothetical protein [Spirochaetaceae bacterium]HCQ87663.1 hypothetical protein [Spirochaetaceae bacterium]